MMCAPLLLVSASCGAPAARNRPATQPVHHDPPASSKRTATLRGPRYPIRFGRPMTVGLRYRDVTTGSQQTKITVGGRPNPLRTSLFSYVYEADCTVKAVVSGGQPVRKELRIIRLEVDTGTGAQTLLPAGTVVDGRVVGGKEQYAIGGKTVSPLAYRALESAVYLYTKPGQSDNELIGTEAPRRIGESWGPNKRRFIAFLKRSHSKTINVPSAEDISGKITLVGLRQIDGVEVLDIRGQIRIDNMAPRRGFSGPGTHQTGHMEYRFTGWLPKDLSIANRSSLQSTFRYYAVIERVMGGTATTMVADTVMTHNSTIRPVP
jgi:hypothetical protein